MRGIFLFAISFVCFFSTLPAQVTEYFSDSNFTANPVWGGDVAKYRVDSAYELQSQGANAATDTFYLSTPNTMMDSTEWNFLVKLNFNPSSTSYSRVYLASDQSNLKGALNGYFIQLGESSSVPDSVSLYVQTGTTVTQVSSGSLGCISNSATSANVRVKVKRSSTGLWQIFADCSGGYNFVLHGQANDLTHIATNWFGVYSRYPSTSASTRWNGFFYDDILISYFIGDTSLPAIDTVYATSATQVVVHFTEPVTLSSAQNILNYSASPTLGNPISAVRNNFDSSYVSLTYGSNFASGQVYTLTVTNISDTVGNLINPPGMGTFVWYIAGTASYKDVRINEIFPDPDSTITNLPPAEFVELYNNGAQMFNLFGWKFTDGVTTATLPAYNLVPGAYLILCKAADTARYSPYGTVLAISLPSLNNGGDNLGLRDNNFTLIDSVRYTTAWYRDAIKAQGGWTLELIDPGDTCRIDSNWIASNNPNGGTPGIQNSVFGSNPDVTPPAIASVFIPALDTVRVCFSERLSALPASNPANYVVNPGGLSPSQVLVDANLICADLIFSPPLDSGVQYTLLVSNATDCPGNVAGTLSQNFIWIVPGNANYKDVVINEIFADPDTLITSLPEAEFLELYNRGTDVYNLNGWTISDGGLTSPLPYHLMNPGDYVILCKAADTAKYSPYGTVVPVVLPTLNNTGDFLGLRSNTGALIDTVPYLDDWYGDINKMMGGWTLELKDPNDTCRLDSNWSASVDTTGGTPGRVNSIFGSNPDNTPPVLLSVTLLSADTLTICFNEKMDGLMLTNPANYSISPSVGTIVSATASGLNHCVNLALSQAVDSSTVYTVSVSNARDCAGNLAANLSAQFAIGAAANPGQIVITEIFPDPSPRVGLPELEFVEIYNKGPGAVSLSGWKLSDRTGTGSSIPPHVMLPGEYLVLCPTSAKDSFSVYGSVLGLSGFPSLNNTGDSLELLNSSLQAADHVYYTDDWYHDPAKKDGGYTLERVDVHFLCQNGDNWRASNDASGGTPARLNSVNGNFTDSIAPTVVSATVSDPSHIRVNFSEEMDAATIDNPAAYTIDRGIGTPLSATASANLMSADLVLSAGLDSNLIYTVNISGAKDCPGNLIGIPDSAMFGIPLEPQPGDILLNEILFNPYTGGSDFVELYNNSQKIIDLMALRLGEVSPGTDSVFNENMLVTDMRLMFPGDHLAFTLDKNFQLNTYLPPFPDHIIETSDMPTFDDTEGECALRSASGVMLDRFHYLDDYHFADLDNKEGVSLERIRWNQATQDPGNWHSAASTVRYATPGYLNSQWEGDGSTGSTEVWLDPAKFSPDNDGFQDVLTLRFKFAQPGTNLKATVFDNQGRFVKVIAQNFLAGTEEGTLTWDGIDDTGKRIDTGIYVLLVETSQPASGETKKIKLGFVSAVKF